MHQISEMIRANPHPTSMDADQLASCIAACFECAQICVACSDACMGEDDPTALVRCIRLDEDCADVCLATGRMLSRQLQPEFTLLAIMVEACAQICAVCAAECEAHAEQHEHCRICAEVCRRCERACRSLLTVAGEHAGTEAVHH